MLRLQRSIGQQVVKSKALAKVAGALSLTETVENRITKRKPV